MTQKAKKLLDRMRRSKSGWKRRDLDRLYEGFDFLITHGANHDIVKHTVYPHLRTTLPRHSYLAQIYVEFAVKLVDELLEIERKIKNGSQKTS
jgi:DNA-binding GntR family transcriptional regulator